MSIETHRVVIGACGWKHKAWLNDFYSEDLPEDWQLGFYSNEFSVVYVPASDWLDVSDSDVPNLDDTDISEWPEDVSETFRFILEISDICIQDEHCFSEALKKASSLGEFCLGLVFQLNPTICDDFKLFQSRYEAAQSIAPVCIDKHGIILPDEFKGILLKRNIAEVWDGQQSNNESVDELGLTRGGLAISHVSGEELDTAQLRKVLEVSLAASSDKCISVLCIDGNPPSIEMLRNADIILNLL